MSKLKKILRSWGKITNPSLQHHGFKSYGKDGFGRITHGNVFQFFLFNIHRHTDTFTIDIGIRPMYCENGEHLNLRPGNRLGKMATKPGLDKWWPCFTDEETDKSVSEILDLFIEFVLPFYNSTRTSTEIIQSYKKNFLGRSKFGNRVSWGTPCYECFDFGYIYLKAGDFSQVSAEFDKCYQFVASSTIESEQMLTEKYLKLKQLCKPGNKEATEYLEIQTQKSLLNLKLEKWLYADIYKTIIQQYHSLTEQTEVENLLLTIKKADITVGADQLARSILAVAEGNITELKKIFDTNYLGNPRDVIMAAVAKTKNMSYFSYPFDY